MYKQLAKPQRRGWIIINFSSLLLIVIIFHLAKYSGIPLLFLIGGSIFFVLLIYSFVKGFWQTNLWKMVHTKMDDLDERQLMVVLNALRFSYSEFIIFCLLIIYLFALVNKGPVNVVIAFCLLYLAHVLPAAIIGWTEKEV